MDKSALPHIVWMHVYFRFELINTVLHKTMIQRNVEVFPLDVIKCDIRRDIMGLGIIEKPTIYIKTGYCPVLLYIVIQFAGNIYSNI